MYAYGLICGYTGRKISVGKRDLAKKPKNARITRLPNLILKAKCFCMIQTKYRTACEQHQIYCKMIKSETLWTTNKEKLTE